MRKQLSLSYHCLKSIIVKAPNIYVLNAITATDKKVYIHDIDYFRWNKTDAIT